jgi:hypothetical protein
MGRKEEETKKQDIESPPTTFPIPFHHKIVTSRVRSEWFLRLRFEYLTAVNIKSRVLGCDALYLVGR